MLDTCKNKFSLDTLLLNSSKMLYIFLELHILCKIINFLVVKEKYKLSYGIKVQPSIYRKFRTKKAESSTSYTNIYFTKNRNYQFILVSPIKV